MFVAKSPLIVTVLLVTAVEMPLVPKKLRSESAILTVSVPVSPAISIVFAPAIKSTYSFVVREFVPKPDLSLYPAGTLTAPVPLGVRVRAVSVAVIEIVDPSISILSTLKLSTLLLASTKSALDAVRVPRAWSSLSVKYLPPIISILAAAPATSVPDPIYNR